MVTRVRTRIIDGDGHIQEDNPAIIQYLPDHYRDQRRGAVFPPLDHMHAGPPSIRLPGASGGGRRIGPPEWIEFLEELGIERTVLYPTGGLAYGKIVDLDWAAAVCRAYNDWIYHTYMQASPRMSAMGLIPLQDPDAAVLELRRIVTEYGMPGAMLPSNGMPSQLGSKLYWPIYAEADRLGCAIAVHGGCHDNMGLDYLNVYAAAHALGHPFGITIQFAGIIFNGVLDRFPNARFAFLEGGVAWFLLCMERFDRSYSTHRHIDGDLPLLTLGPDETVADRIQRYLKRRQLFIGCEGEEGDLPHAARRFGSEPFFFSSDFPHEVNNEMCRREIEEVLESDELGQEDIENILFRNAEAFYRLS